MTSTRLRTFAVAAILAVPLIATGWLAPASAASDCPSGSTQFKIDQRPSNGTYSDGTLEVTISNSDEDSFSWSSNIAVDSVVVKGGPVTKTNSGGTSGTASSPDNPNNNQRYGISHVSFCYSTSSSNGGGGGGGGDCVDDKKTEADECDNGGDCVDDKKTEADECDNGGGGGGDECDANPNMAGTQPCDNGGGGGGGKKCDADPNMPGNQPCDEVGADRGEDKGADADDECDADADMPGIQPCDDVAGERLTQPAQADTDTEVKAGRIRGETTFGDDDSVAPGTIPRGQPDETGPGVLPRTGNPALLPFVALAALLATSGALLYRRGRG